MTLFEGQLRIMPSDRVRVRRLAAAMLPGAEVGDLVHEALAESWAKRGSFNRVNESDLAWTLRAVMRRADRSHAQAATMRVNGDPGGDLGSRSEERLSREVRRAVDLLATLQQKLVILHYYVNVPPSVVGEVLDIDEEAFQSGLRSASEVIAEALGGHGDLDVEELLASDARRWWNEVDTDFSTVQTTATNSPPTQSKASPQWSLALGITAVLAIGATAIGGVALHRGSGDSPSLELQSHPTPGAIDPLTPERIDVPVTPIARLTAAQARHGLSSRWRLAAISNNPAGLTIEYDAGDGDCTTPRGVVVSETRTHVLLEVVLNPAPSGTGCSTKLVRNAATVMLHRPLGKRPLLHATLSP